MDKQRRQHRSSDSKNLVTQRLSALIVSSCVGFIVASCTQQTAVNVVTETIDTYSIADSFPKDETRQVTAISKDLIKTRTIRFGYQKGGIFPISRQRGKLEQELKQQNIKVEWSGPFDRCASLLEAINGDRSDIGGCSDIPFIY